MADPLQRYREKRNFKLTAEPAEGGAPSEGLPVFVIQKHWASRLHYDLRLEVDGTMKSWAVPKGPSYDPKDKRMAVQVEDHPIAYNQFEGQIPEGQYGAGKVIIWDEGQWEPLEDPREGLAQGMLKFLMHGRKMIGKWALIRMKHRSDEKQPPWLLIKEKDAYVKPADEFSVVDEMPDSVVPLREKGKGKGQVAQKAGARTSAKAVEGAASRPAKTAAGAAAKSAAKASTKAASKTASAKATSKTASKTALKTAAKPSARTAAKTAIKSSGNVLPKAATPTASGKAAAAPAASKSSGAKAARGRAEPAEAPELPGVAAALPAELKPQLATLVDGMPGDPRDWLFEIKYDGYRLLARIDGKRVQLFTRNGHDWTHKLPELEAAVRRMKIGSGWLDGEIVVQDAQGIPSFQLLQNAFDSSRTARIVYYVFDAPYLEGRDLRAVPQDARREIVRSLVARGEQESIRFSESFDARPQDLVASACRMGLEGVIGKRRDGTYIGRRSSGWIKLKCAKRQEFVIGGYTDPKGGRVGLGSLLLGVHDEKGGLRYAGNVGTGFDAATLAEVKKKLDAIAAEQSPFDGKTQHDRSAHWVRPDLMAEVSFGEWTADGHVRHSVFKGLRADKPPRAITREVPEPAPKAGRKVAKTKASASANATAAAASKGVRATTTARPRASSPKASTPPPAKKTAKTAKPAPSDARLHVTHPERVIDNSTGLTKLDLVRFYAKVAPLLLVHLKARPVSLVRAPSGIGGQLFFQKHLESKMAGVRALDPSLDPDHPPYLEVPTAEAVLSAAQMNVVEFHTWNAVKTAIDQPDRMTFDLDPGEGVAWKSMQQAAELMRVFLDELGLRAFLKTSGGKGLHVVVPVRRQHDWDTIKSFSQAVVQHLARTLPKIFVAKSGPANRIGKIFIDYLRNGFGATTASAWSARARPGLGVSVPVGWDELGALSSGAHWSVGNIEDRLAIGNGPWDGYQLQAVNAAMKRLGFEA